MYGVALECEQKIVDDESPEYPVLRKLAHVLNGNQLL